MKHVLSDSFLYVTLSLCDFESTAKFLYRIRPPSGLCGELGFIYIARPNKIETIRSCLGPEIGSLTSKQVLIWGGLNSGTFFPWLVQA